MHCSSTLIAIPTLAVTWSARVDSEVGSAIAAVSRSATWVASRIVTSSHSTTNSSPPIRPIVSDGRSVGLQAAHDVDEQLVADVVPVRVVDRLEVVEVDV